MVAVLLSNEEVEALEEGARSTAVPAPTRKDEVLISHALNEHIERLSKPKREMPPLSKYNRQDIQLFVRDWGMFTKEGDKAVSELMRYVEDMMFRRVDKLVVDRTINQGLKTIAKQGHTEVYDSWPLNEIAQFIDMVIDDLINDGNDPLLRFFDEPTTIDVMTEEELRPFRREREDEGLYQLPVP